MIVIFTELVDWVGDFWSQVIYFVAIFGGVLLAAQTQPGDRLERAVATQPWRARDYAGRFAGAVRDDPGTWCTGLDHGDRRDPDRGDKGLLWGFSGFVLILVGGVGLVFWTAGIVSARRRAG